MSSANPHGSTAKIWNTAFTSGFPLPMSSQFLPRARLLATADLTSVPTGLPFQGVSSVDSCSM